ncbi:hypothetical protein [Haloarcula litorea]|uniref:hypothetical protein n=1 Tax=Haloarcula litorea TaxID=3032579 RepID=UPI0023E7592B|nr:hypothetical protein [Halomicroarcula sp. GDY20]
MAVPDVINTLASLEDGEEVRVELKNGIEFDGVVECTDVMLHVRPKHHREVTVTVAIDEDTAKRIDTVYHSVPVSAYRKRSGWTNATVSHQPEYDEEKGRAPYETLGVVDEIERID